MDKFDLSKLWTKKPPKVTKMDNQRYFYLAEGECEEKLLNALKLKPSLIHPGKVERFNVIQNEIPTRKLMRYPSGCVVVLR